MGKSNHAHPYRKQLVNNQTKSELKFWRLLQAVLKEHFPHMQHNVMKQATINHPRGFYILDFYIGKLKVAFEIDGGYHWGSKQLDKDLKRDSFLTYEKGIKVYHIPNNDLKYSKRKRALKERLIKILHKRTKIFKRKQQKKILYSNTGSQYKPGNLKRHINAI